MKNRITYRIIFLLLLWNALCCGSPSFLSAQTLKMALSKEITMAPMDMDAMSYFPVKDSGRKPSSVRRSSRLFIERS